MALTSMSFIDSSFLQEIKGSSLNICLSNGSNSWFCIKCHLSIRMFSSLVKTVEIMWQRVECFWNVRSQCLFQSLFLPVPMFNFWEDIIYLLFRVASRIRRALNFLTFSSNIAFEQFVLRSLRDSPFTKPFNAGWVTAVEVC